MERKSVYIAGPMRGIPYYNFPAFDDAAESLSWSDDWGDIISPAQLDRDAGFDPCDPDCIPDPDNHDWSQVPSVNFSLIEAIERDVKAIQRCGAIYMLDGWENSKGATAEKALAEWIGLEVLYQSLPKVEPREDILEEALRITSGDRQASYGPPDQDFRRTAAMWNVLFEPFIKQDEGGESRLELPPRMVAAGMVCLKMSRETHQGKRDNWTDAAGYSRCGYKCLEVEKTRAEQ